MDSNSNEIVPLLYGPRFIWKQKQFLSSMILVNQGILAIALGTTSTW